MKVFVWTGENVLKNYTSGMVVIAANSEEDAWERLRKDNFRVYFWLKTGVSHYYSIDETWLYTETEDLVEGFPIPPQSFELENLPILVKEGGE